MHESFTFYCDESGNSGPNYIDAGQPFLVVGGFLLPDDRIVDIAVALEEVRREYSAQSEELKSATVLRRPSGVECVDAMVSKIGRLGAWPMFVVAEKRYCVAGKIVETFMDPAFNDRLRAGFTGDDTTKRQLANDLLQLLTSETLDAFARAYRRPDPTSLGAALDHVVEEARAKLSPEIATLLEGARPHLVEIAEDEGWQTGGDVNGINLPAVLTLFQLIEAIGRTGALKISKFVHDETASHEEAYRQTFLTYRALGDEVIRLPSGVPVLAGLKSIPHFETQKSEYSPWVQAADLFTGTINRACRRIQDGEVFEGEEKRLHSLLFTPLLMHEPPLLSWAVTSSAFLMKMARAVGWTGDVAAGRPAHDPSALLPLVGASRPRPPEGPRVRVPCPMWVLTERDDRLVTVQRRSAPGSDDADPWAVVPVFSSEDGARTFVSRHYPGDDLRFEALGADPDTFVALLQKLEAASGIAKYLVLDCHNPGPWHLLSIEESVAKLRGILERVVRGAISGVGSVLRQEHQMDGRTFVTVLLSSGEYAGADLANQQQFVTAASRDEALALAVEQSRRLLGAPNDDGPAASP